MHQQSPTLSQEDVFRILAVKGLFPSQGFDDVLSVMKAIEHLHWDYMDNFRAQHNLPSLSKLASFAKAVSEYAPEVQKLITDWDSALTIFRKYQHSCVRAKLVVLNPDATSILTVLSFNNTLDFPGGKINEGESPVDCAIREGREELGFDIRPYIVPNAVVTRNNSHYVLARGVPEKTKFKPLLPGEVKQYHWYAIPALLSGKVKKSSFLVNTHGRSIADLCKQYVGISVNVINSPSTSPISSPTNSRPTSRRQGNSPRACSPSPQRRSSTPSKVSRPTTVTSVSSFSLSLNVESFMIDFIKQYNFQKSRQ
ncbi:hypothetical protein RCL1_000458 [Eukaryota sp. TZLM3-RCL]